MSEITEVNIDLQGQTISSAAARVPELAGSMGYTAIAHGPGAYELVRHRRHFLRMRTESMTLAFVEDRSGPRVRVVGNIDRRLLERLAGRSGDDLIRAITPPESRPAEFTPAFQAPDVEYELPRRDDRTVRPARQSDSMISAVPTSGTASDSAVVTGWIHPKNELITSGAALDVPASGQADAAIDVAADQPEAVGDGLSSAVADDPADDQAGVVPDDQAGVVADDQADDLADDQADDRAGVVADDPADDQAVDLADDLTASTVKRDRADPTPLSVPVMTTADGSTKILARPTVIGRNPSHAVGPPGAEIAKIADPSLSKSHCVLAIVDGDLLVTDMHSLNGTRVEAGGKLEELLPGQTSRPVPLPAVVWAGEARLDIAAAGHRDARS